MDNKERLIDYLYGEMSEADRRQFEEVLAKDSELQAELESFRQTRLRLAQMPEVRTEATVITVQSLPITWKKWAISIGAAGVLVLLLSLANARLEVGKNGFVLAMGETQPFAMERVAVNKEESLLAAMEDQFLQRDRELDQKLLQLDSLWRHRLIQREERLQQSWDRQLAAYQARRQQELEQFAQYLVAEEMPDLVTLIQHLQLEQQDELRLLLSQFWNQWQETRAADLQSIGTEFVNLYRNVELNQTETQAILKDVLAGGR